MPKPQKKVNKKSGKKVQRGPVDLNESMSSGQSEYDDGSKAKFTEMVEGKIRNAQAQLFEDDFVGYSQGSFAGLATGSAFEAPKAPESDELFKKLSKILNEFEAQPPSGNKMKDNFGRLYQLLILFLKTCLEKLWIPTSERSFSFISSTLTIRGQPSLFEKT